MIAQWIAQALLKGQDHLTLSTAELAHWQRNGCQVTLGAPWRALGMYAVAHTGKCGQMLEQHLLQLPPSEWPVGSFYAGPPGNGLRVFMPAHEFVPVGAGEWHVPLVPSDPNHCLDSWAFDLNLSAEELQALKPVAYKLAKRMLVRCEIKRVESALGKDAVWNAGRLALCDLAGIEPLRLHVWFAIRGEKNGTVNGEALDSPDCVQAWSDRVNKKKTSSEPMDIGVEVLKHANKRREQAKR